jgi:hypothetical protein
MKVAVLLFILASFVFCLEINVVKNDLSCSGEVSPLCFNRPVELYSLGFNCLVHLHSHTLGFLW